MTIEQITSGAASTIADLDPTLPAASDNKSEGDDHIRNTKKALQLTFANISATVSSVASELDFAHKGGTVSGNATVKGAITCDSLSVSGTAVVSTKLVTEDLAVAGSVTVSGTAVFVSPATFEKTVSISHVVAANIIGGTFQTNGTAIVRSTTDLTASRVGTGQYVVRHLWSAPYVVVAASTESAPYATHAFGGDLAASVRFSRYSAGAAKYVDTGFNLLFYKI